jgi:hypothetical protein
MSDRGSAAAARSDLGATQLARRRGRVGEDDPRAEFKPWNRESFPA